MRQLIRNVLIVTMNDQNQLIEDGAIVIDGNRIRSVGPASELATGAYDRVIDGKHYIAIPGLINAHGHTPANIFRGLIPGRPLEIWRAYWRAALRVCGDEAFYASALLGAMEMLKTGCTTTLDHFFGNQNSRYTGAGSAIRAMRELGLRHIVALTVSDRPYEQTIPIAPPTPETTSEVDRMSTAETKDTAAWLEEVEAFISEHHAPERLTTCCPGPSAVQRCTDVLLQGAAELSEKFDVPLHIHLAETRSQSLMGPKLYGASLLKHLDELGVVSSRLSMAHAIWIEDDDVDIIARKGATAVHNPASNLRLGSGLAPVPAMLKAGGHVALGVDGACSNDNQNMFDAMRLAALIHNTRDHDFKNWVDPLQAMSMATHAAGRAFGLDCGVLAPGQLADIVLLNRRTPAFTPLNDVVTQLVFCENGSSVDTVFVDGDIVVQGGRLTKMDEADLLQRVNQLYEPMIPGIQKEMHDAAVMEPSLSEMYFRVFSDGGAV